MKTLTALLAALVVLTTMPVAPMASPGSNADDRSATDATSVTNIDTCRVIDDPGRYALTRDIEVEDGLQSYCIHITASNVTFDGNGHTVEGNYSREKDFRENVSLAAASSGVLVAGNETLSNVTVRNVTVEDWKFGINYTDVTDSRVVGVTGVTNRYRGVYLDDFDGGVVADTTITRTYGPALHVSGDDNVIRDNNLSGNDVSSQGILPFDWRGLLVSGTNNSVEDNYIADNVDNGKISGGDATVANNTVGGLRGLTVEATDARVANNTVTESILYVNGSRIVVEDNTFEGGTLGLSGDRILARGNTLRDSTLTPGESHADSTVARNTFERSSIVMNEDGRLNSVPVHNLTVAGNDVSDGHITLGRASNSSVRDNRVDGGTYGLRLVGPLDGTVVAGNVLTNNTDGIRVGTWSDLVIRRNEIRNNGDGIHVYFSPYVGYDKLSTDSAGGDCPNDDGGTNLSLAVYRNAIVANEAFDIHNEANETVNATDNYWGGSDGPSSNGSDDDAPFEDPITGAPANGSGDAVSEGPDDGVSNVHFDPFLGEDPTEE